MRNPISLRSRNVDGQQETNLLLRDMTDEDILRYIHEVLALDINCQYERLVGRDDQEYPTGPDVSLLPQPSPPRRSVRLSQRTAKRRYTANDEKTVVRDHEN